MISNRLHHTGIGKGSLDTVSLSSSIMGAKLPSDVADDARGLDGLVDDDDPGDKGVGTQLKGLSENLSLDTGSQKILDRMICDAKIHSTNSGLKLPWASEQLQAFFSQKVVSILPKVENVIMASDHPGAPGEKRGADFSEAVRVVDHKRTYFDHAVSVRAGRTRSLNLGSQYGLMYKRWESIVSMDYESSTAGMDIHQLPWEKRVILVGRYLAGKSVNTLNKRYGQACRYVKFVAEEAFSSPFPFTEELTKAYVVHIAKESKSHSAATGFIECVSFMKHVLGFRVPLEALASPLSVE